MTHFKSTIATLAIIAGGLLAASPYPYPSTEAAPRSAPQAVLSEAASPSETSALWSDPPARRIAETSKPAIVAEAKPAEAVQAVAPEAAPPAIAEPTGAPARKQADRTPRRKIVHNAQRVRQVASRQVAPAVAMAPSAANAGAAATTAQRPIDPIGDILRGLGFGRAS